MNRFKYLFTLSISITAFLSGCVIGPSYKRPDISLPEQFLAESATTTNTKAWFDGFNDPILTALLHTAATNNLTILQAMQRVRASRATLSGAKADYWPNVGFSASASKTKSFDPDATSERIGGGFDASWEPDLFGKKRRTVEAATAELEATELSLADAKLTLDAEIAAELAAEDKKKAKKKEKPKKEKKPKKVVIADASANDTGEKDSKKGIGAKGIVATLLVCASLLGLILVGTYFVPTQLSLIQARTAFYAQDYEETTMRLMGRDLNSSDRILYDKANLLYQQILEDFEGKDVAKDAKKALKAQQKKAQKEENHNTEE